MHIRKHHPQLAARLIMLLLSCSMLAAMLAACGHYSGKHADQLHLIDSLADENPALADSILRTIELTSAPEEQMQEAYTLLRIKADDKLYRPISHYRDTILQLVSYYEHHRHTPLGNEGLPLAYTYAGRIFADIGSAPQAMDYYQHALDAMPAYKEGESSRTTKQRGLLHSFIAETFYFQALYREAIASLQEANRFAMLANDTLDLIFNYRDIGEEYKFLNKNDSSLLFYERALSLAHQTHNINMCNDVMAQIASLYIAIGELKKAKQYIQPALCNIDTVSISGVYSIAAKCYLHLQQTDSARYFINKLLIHGNIYGKRFAHAESANFAIHDNNAYAALQHIKQYKALDDSIRKRDNAETVARMHAAYNYQLHERKALQYKTANDRKKNIIVGIGIFLAALLFMTLWILAKYRERKRRVDELQQLHGELMQKYELLTADYDKKLQDIDLLLQLNNENYSHSKLKQERCSIEYARILAAIEKDKINAATAFLHQTRVFKKILDAKPSALKLTQQEWKDIEDAVNEAYPNFSTRLEQFIPGISTKEKNVALLLKGHVSHITIASLICTTQGGESNIRRRLCEKVMPSETPSAAKFDNFIDSL